MDKDLVNHKKVIAVFLNSLRASPVFVHLMADVVDDIHAQDLHLVVTKEGPYTEVDFNDIMIIERSH